MYFPKVPGKHAIRLVLQVQQKLHIAWQGGHGLASIHAR